VYVIIGLLSHLATHQQIHIIDTAITVLYSLKRVIELDVVFVTHLKYLSTSNVLHTCTYEEQSRQRRETLQIVLQVVHADKVSAIDIIGSGCYVVITRHNSVVRQG
jgi:hypothetical protein